jgi:hypothetical protein
MEKNGHRGHSFAFNILAANLQARNSLQSPNSPRVTPSAFDGAAFGCGLGDGSPQAALREQPGGKCGLTGYFAAEEAVETAGRGFSAATHRAEARR